MTDGVLILGPLLALVIAWLLFRDADPRDPDVWEGVALGLTIEMLHERGQDLALDTASLWQLDAERARALHD